jgi:hypothetical protein
LVKDLEARDWLCGWWASDQFREVLEWNRQSRLSKELMHLYGVDEHVRKTQKIVRKTHNLNSQLLPN